MPSDDAIKSEIQAALDRHPELMPATITLAVKNGVATIGGFVQTLNQKWIVKDILENAEGVSAIVDELELRLPAVDRRPDPEIANAIATALGLELGNAADNIRISVQNGTVTLEGVVESRSQRRRASEIAARTRDVIAVSNELEVHPGPAGITVKRRIEDTFRRNAEIDANNIEVETVDGRVVLSGAVRSWVERQEAEQVARQTPGVSAVENHIVVAVGRLGASP
jgi:osmotically-inducible protein OsmY